jgi:uncharacterized membrane protein YfcA
MLLNISTADSFGMIAIFIAMFLGGILKGATGSGAPIIAIPVIAAFYDVRLAVIILVIPNFLINIWQIYKFRAYNLEPMFTRNFAIAGLLGAAIGTAMLSWIAIDKLNVLMAFIVFAYIALRLAKPAFHIPLERANKLVWYAGVGGGFLQGALGVSAPISVTFANAIKLQRPVFIFTISVFFTAMCVAQMPLQIAYGMVSWQTLVVGVFAFIPLIAGLPVGEMIGKHMSAKIFDRVILTMLAVLAFKLLFSVLY